MSSVCPRVVFAFSLAFTATVAFGQGITYQPPDIVAQTGDSSTSTFRIINLSNTELFRVTATGAVGVDFTSSRMRT